MILYKNTIKNFKNDVIRKNIVYQISKSFYKYYKRKPSLSEIKSWKSSLNILNNVLCEDLKDSYIVFEYELPLTSKRIDLILFGKDKKNKENVVILELKQWSNNSVRKSKFENNVRVRYDHGWEDRPHPSLQIEGYYLGIRDFLEIFQKKNAPQLKALVYLSNYSKRKDEIIFSQKFSSFIDKFPIFTKEDTLKLSNYLKEQLGGGEGQIIYEKFVKSRVSPSKKLIDHTQKMINKRQIFRLIDEQIVSYNAIVSKAKEIVNTGKKSVIIIKGGPGTGKSVIALEVMGELLRQGKKVMHATGSSAFTNILRKVVGSRARGLFKFFNSFTNLKPNSIDVLICDEAHRIRKTSESLFTAKHLRNDKFQIDELLSVAQLCVFLIDEQQIIRPKEIGSVELIKDASLRNGISKEEIYEFELKTQFRCFGSDAYLQWLDNVLKIKETSFKEFDSKIEFKIFRSPGKMMNEIIKRNKEKHNSARITAGICWPWSKPNPDGSLVNDIKIGSFKMPWENKDRFWEWAISEEGIRRVGNVYLAQGFEFDYIGVIFGDDLVYDFSINDWRAISKNSYDIEAKKNNPNLVNHLKNAYRVLLTRAHKGVYVYFMNKDTEKYFRSRLPSRNTQQIKNFFKSKS